MADKNTFPTTLFDLGKKYDTDKITHHRYDRYFEQYFTPIQNGNIKLFEIGVENKKSLNLWLSYFPNAMIYGLDISLSFEADRCKVFRGDQSDPGVFKEILNEIDKFNIIIDDGSHVPEHQLLCFNYLFDKGLEDGGVYIIEDIETSYWKHARIYGYEFSYGIKHPLNIIEIFKQSLHHINREFLLDHEIEDIRNHSKIEFETLRHISSIMFAKNCVIIKKMDKLEYLASARPYRFKRAIENT